MTHRSSLRQWWCEPIVLWIMNSWIFFLVRAASPFTLRRFGAQINPHRLLSKYSLINFAGESGNRNTFFNGKWHVQNENGPQSPRSKTYAEQLSTSWLTLFLVTKLLTTRGQDGNCTNIYLRYFFLKPYWRPDRSNSRILKMFLNSYKKFI